MSTMVLNEYTTSILGVYYSCMNRIEYCQFDDIEHHSGHLCVNWKFQSETELKCHHNEWIAWSKNYGIRKMDTNSLPEIVCFL